MKTKLLKISSVVTTAGTQIRAKIDVDTVEQYAEAMQDATNKFPPVVVFHDGSQFILADGFHRVMAAARNGFTDIDAEVNKGTRTDALKFALGANSTHGLKRTNADKRRSVELALAEWPKISDREIARICFVSAEMVGDVRPKNQLSDSDSCHKCKDCGAEIDSRADHFTGQCLACHKSNPPTRIGADGKERRMPRRELTKDESSRLAETNNQRLSKAISGYIGQQIATYRTARGMTMDDLGRRAGLTTGRNFKQRVYEIEHNLRSVGIRFGTVYQIAIALEVDARDLMPSVKDAQAMTGIKLAPSEVVSMG